MRSTWMMVAMVAVGLCGCEGDKKAGEAEAKGAKEAKEAKGSGESAGTMDVGWGTMDVASGKLPVGSALVYEKGKKLRILVASKNIGTLTCDGGVDDHSFEEGQFAIELWNDAPDHVVKFDGKAGTYPGIGFTLHWVDEEGRGVSSSEFPAAKLPSKLVIESVDAKRMVGRYTLKQKGKWGGDDDVTVAFSAKRCPS